MDRSRASAVLSTPVGQPVANGGFAIQFGDFDDIEPKKMSKMMSVQMGGESRKALPGSQVGTTGLYIVVLMTACTCMKANPNPAAFVYLLTSIKNNKVILLL